MPLFRSYMEADAADADSQASQAAVTVRTTHPASTIKIYGREWQVIPKMATSFNVNQPLPESGRF